MEKTLQEFINQLFGKRSELLSLWQCIAEQFYPERADFTTVLTPGDEFATHLTTSFPVICRRSLGDQFGAMLRPTAKEWFHMRTDQPTKENTRVKQWLEWAARVQKRAMYDRRAQFTRATKQGDHDFATFGQTVISVRLNRDGDALLYRCWHLRDVAWLEDESGEIAAVFRRWKPTNRDLMRLHPATVHNAVREASTTKEAFEKVKCVHVCMRRDIYEGMNPQKAIKHPWVSVHFDEEHSTLMEVVGAQRNEYVIPRWVVLSGSQYAHSPATSVALPDARLLQRISTVLLEAGEKGVTPPMVATQEAIRGDVNVYAGGITWVDSAYDERLGEVLRPITTDKTGVSFGLALEQDIRQMITEGFFLNKINLPPASGREMTAYEVGQRVQEHIRAILPIFEPMEQDYNGQLCEATFEELMINRAFGPVHMIPEELQSKEIQFVFESPLRDAEEKVRSNQLIELRQVIAAVMDIDPTAPLIINTKKAVRSVAEIVAPIEWLNDEATVDEIIAKQTEQAQAAQQLELMQQGAKVAETLQKTQIGQQTGVM